VDGINDPNRGGSSRMNRELCGLQGNNMDEMKSEWIRSCQGADRGQPMGDNTKVGKVQWG
jgi:hypothetical protein